MDNAARYKKFIEAYKKAYCSSGSKETILKNGQAEWNKIKILDSSVFDDRIVDSFSAETKGKFTSNLVECISQEKGWHCEFEYFEW